MSVTSGSDSSEPFESTIARNEEEVHSNQVGNDDYRTMTFGSHKEAVDYIIEQEKKRGYSVVRRSSTKTSVYLQCRRSGNYNSRLTNRVREKYSGKTDCPFRAYVGASFTVSRTVMEHNHPPDHSGNDLLVKKTGDGASEDEGVDKLLELHVKGYVDAGFGAEAIRKIIAVSHPELSISRQDVANYIQKLNGKQDNSMAAVVEHLHEQQEHGWLYATSTIANHLERLAWVSPAMLKNLDNYGDV